ncbi:hypothetical protein [Sulfurimonas sp.]|uniref:hypothetical protein n=1 Tax=Sulfurimonas sp. TaxID=2022749 RepID=UPI003D148C46
MDTLRFRILYYIFDCFGIVISMPSNAELYTSYLMANNFKRKLRNLFSIKKIHKNFLFRFTLPDDENSINLFKLQLTMDFYKDMYFSSYDEFFALYHFMKNNIARENMTIVDLGGGMGRSSVFFNNLFRWSKNKIYLVDKSITVNEISESFIDGERQLKETRTNYHHNMNIQDSAYTNKEAMLNFVQKNNTHNLEFIDYDDFTDMEFDFDLLYSFHCVGYHFSIKESIEKLNILKKAKKGAYLIYGVRRSCSDIDNYEIPKTIGDDFQFVKIFRGKHRQNFLVFQKIT